MLHPSNGFDITQTYEELDRLTLLEAQLISRAHAMCQVVTLHSTGERAYRGHVVNLHQDIESFATELPVAPRDTRDSEFLATVDDIILRRLKCKDLASSLELTRVSVLIGL